MGIQNKQKRPAMTLRAAVQLAAPHTWPAAVLPVLLGGSLAWAEGYRARPWILFFTLAVAVLLQSAVNTLNDYRDFVSGLDTAENCTDPTDAALIYECSSTKAVLALGLAFLAGAGVFGGLLVISCGPVLIIYGALGLAAILLYVMPGISLSGRPFGELLSGGAMGGVLTCAAFHAQAGSFYIGLIWLCLPAVVTIGCILLVNNTCDIEKDLAGGRNTLSGYLGRERSRLLLRVCLSLAAAGVIAVIALRYKQGIAAVPVLIISLAVSAPVREIYTGPVDPEHRRTSMGGVLAAHCRIIACYIAGLIIFSAA